VLNPGGNDATSSAWSQNVVGTLAGALAVGDQAATFNGDTVATAAPASIPTGLNTIRMGSLANSGAFWEGYILRAVFWASNRLSNAALQALRR
jgi:hypothetical protein